MEKLRSEISDDYKWSLDDLFPKQDDYLKELDEILVLIEKYSTFQGQIVNNLKEFLEFDEEVNERISLVYVYAQMKLDEDSTNQISKANVEKVANLYTKFVGVSAFALPEIISAGSKKINELIENNEVLKKYKFDFEKLFRYEAHTLPKEQEELLANFAGITNAGSKIFYNINNTDRNLGMIKDEDGKLVLLTPSNYAVYIKSEDSLVRSEAYNKMFTYYKNHINTISECLKNHVKEEWAYARVKNYNSMLEASLYSDSINVDVYKNLVKVVSNNTKVLHEYYKIKKQYLKLDEMKMSDVYLEFLSDNEQVFSYEDAKKILFESLLPLGSDYLKDLELAFTEKWIDVYPNKGKKSGAYKWGSYRTKPFVLLNFNDTFDAVSTMHHELGHAMHSYYSNKENSSTYSQYPIFLAEVASTVNEVLLVEYMLKNAKTKSEKIYYLNIILEKIKATFFRQTMFAEFEMIIHELEKNEEAITEEVLSSTYLDLVKKYHGDAFVYDDLIKYEWARIPHFYSSFYVYKYATGLAAAFDIAYGILDEVEGSKESYLEFLKSGGSDYPMNILKKTGVDMTSSEPINKVIKIFEEKMKEMKELLEGEDTCE